MVEFKLGAFTGAVETQLGTKECKMFIIKAHGLIVKCPMLMIR